MLKFLLVVILIGVAVYLIVRVIQRRGIKPPTLKKKAPPPRIVGPDDDPDFLRDLDTDIDKKKRHPDEDDSAS